MVIGDTFGVYYLNDLVLYELPIHADSTNLITDSSGNFVFDKVLKTWIEFRYFVFKKDARFGLSYDSVTDKKGMPFSVDSLLNRKTYKSAMFYKKENYNLAKSYWNDSKDVWIEEYAIKSKPDESYQDSIIFYFTKGFYGIDYSFSRELDSLKSMKLFKVRMIRNPLPKGTYPFDVPRREMLFELIEERVSNATEISRLVKRFEKQFRSAYTRPENAR